MVTVADLGRLAASSLLADEQVGAEVVCLVFVRTPTGEYVTASAQQLTWPEVMVVLNRRAMHRSVLDEQERLGKPPKE